MAICKFVPVSRPLKGILEYVMNREKTTARLITGVNCVAETALDEMNAVKNQFRKTDGRSYYHIVQSFSPDDPIDFDTAHQIGLQFAEYFQGFQCVVATHMNTAHKHNHIILNSVNFENGKKFHQSKNEMLLAKEYSNKPCQAYGLSITESKADRNDQPDWKKKLKHLALQVLKFSKTREDFIRLMESQGYKIKWEDKYKYITFTTPNNQKCRDDKLFDERLLRENMEKYFKLGGCQSTVAEKYHTYQPEADQEFGGLASLLDLFLGSHQGHYHLEHIHHSKEAIEKMLAVGIRISSDTLITVADDDDEEYKRNHGFGLTM